MTRRGWLWVGVVLLATVGWAQAQGQEPAEAWPDLTAADVRAVLEPMGFEVEEATIAGRAAYPGPGQSWPIQYFRATTVDGEVTGALTFTEHIITELHLRGAAATVWRPAASVDTAADAVSVGRLYLRRMGLDPERWILSIIFEPGRLTHWTVVWRERLPDGMPTYATARMTISAATGAMSGFYRVPLARTLDDPAEPVVTAEGVAQLALAQVGREGEWPYLPTEPLTVREVKLLLTYKPDADDVEEWRPSYEWQVVYTGLGRYAASEPGRPPFKVAGRAWVDAYTGKTEGILNRADVAVVDGELFTW